MSGGSRLGPLVTAGGHQQTDEHRMAGFTHGCLVGAEKWILVEPGRGMAANLN